MPLNCDFDVNEITKIEGKGGENRVSVYFGPVWMTKAEKWRWRNFPKFEFVLQAFGENVYVSGDTTRSQVAFKTGVCFKGCN